MADLNGVDLLILVARSEDIGSCSRIHRFLHAFVIFEFADLLLMTRGHR